MSLVILQANITPCLGQNLSGVELSRGTSVKVRLTSGASSKSKADITAIVDSDVSDRNNQTVVIKAGTPVELSIDWEKAKGMGKSGHLFIKCLSTKSVDGKDISLSGSLNEEGDGKSGLALGLWEPGLRYCPWSVSFFPDKRGKRGNLAGHGGSECCGGR